MSELRMLIQSYANDLILHLDVIGHPHTNIKDKFRDLDDKVVQEHTLEPTYIDGQYNLWREQLSLLEEGTSNLKIEIAAKLGKLTK